MEIIDFVTPSDFTPSKQRLNELQKCLDEYEQCRARLASLLTIRKEQSISIIRNGVKIVEASQGRDNHEMVMIDFIDFKEEGWLSGDSFAFRVFLNPQDKYYPSGIPQVRVSLKPSKTGEGLESVDHLTQFGLTPYSNGGAARDNYITNEADLSATLIFICDELEEKYK